MNDIIFTPALVLLIVALAVWSLLWKALALWHSARRNEAGWFIVFMFINTLGILEIIYLFGVAKFSSRTLGKDQPVRKTAKKSTRKK